jgi:2-polyprenyl-3-methyl-5-hydroxy-6-metoxy-1,4-benzoquinol methylase
MNYKIRRFIRDNTFIYKLIAPLYRFRFKIKRSIKIKKHQKYGLQLPDAEKLYWINPKNILYYLTYQNSELVELQNSVIGSDWDLYRREINDLEIYKTFQRSMLEGGRLDKEDYFRCIKNIGRVDGLLGYDNKDELKRKFQDISLLLDELKRYIDITNRGMLDYKSLTEVFEKYKIDQIEVSICRDGKYVVHHDTLVVIILILLNLQSIPVKVLHRHENWIQFRNHLLGIASLTNKKLYQPALHPDLIDIPAARGCIDRFEAMKEYVPISGGTLLDIGCNLGYFCHKFEDMGYSCTGLEMDKYYANAADNIRKSVDKSFEIVRGDALNPSVTNKIAQHFDVVIILSVLHHYLLSKVKYDKMTKWLNSLKSHIIFFEPHDPMEESMQKAYMNFNNEEFVQYILENTRKSNVDEIYRSPNNRAIYMLT